MEPVYTTAPEPTTDERHYFIYESIADDQGGGVAGTPTREGLFETAGGAMKFESRARRVFRHGPSATMVRQLLHWSDKGHDPDGYIYKTYAEWWEEEGLSRTELDTARRKLGEEGVGVLEEKRKGVPCRLYYRLDLLRLWELMFPELQGPGDDDPVPESQTLNHNYRVQGSYKQVCGDAASKFAGNTPSIYRENAEIISEIPSGGEPPEQEPSTPTPQDAGEHPVENNVAEVVELDPTHGLANRMVTKVVGDLKDRGVVVGKSKRGRLAGEFADLVSQGVTEERLLAAAERIVERRVDPDRKPYLLMPDDALADLDDRSKSGGRSSSKGSAGPATPEPALSALRESDSLGRFSAAAERHDFTSRQEPEWKVLQQCGATDQERRDNARKMGNVARNAMNRAEREDAGEPKPSSAGSFKEGYEWFFDE